MQSTDEIRKIQPTRLQMFIQSWGIGYMGINVEKIKAVLQRYKESINLVSKNLPVLVFLISVVTAFFTAFKYFIEWVFTYGKFNRLGIDPRYIDCTNKSAFFTVLFAIMIGCGLFIVVLLFNTSKKCIKACLITTTAILDVSFFFYKLRSFFPVKNIHHPRTMIVYVGISLIASAAIYLIIFIIWAVFTLLIYLIKKQKSDSDPNLSVNSNRDLCTMVLLGLLLFFMIYAVGYFSTYYSNEHEIVYADNKNDDTLSHDTQTYVIDGTYANSYICSYCSIKSNTLSISYNKHILIPMTSTSIYTYTFNSVKIVDKNIDYKQIHE